MGFFLSPIPDIIRHMGKTRPNPWDLPPAKIAEAVVAFRVLMDMSAETFYESVGMHHQTLAKVEKGETVDKRVIGRIDRRFPGVFA